VYSSGTKAAGLIGPRRTDTTQSEHAEAGAWQVPQSMFMLRR
jgi:hypothetical protein